MGNTACTKMLYKAMAIQYLHLSIYPCEECDGPVVSGSLAVRENEISNETDKREIGAICLSCGHRQIKASEANTTRKLPPVEWQRISTFRPAHIAAAPCPTDVTIQAEVAARK
jgi:hypothetical protein